MIVAFDTETHLIVPGLLAPPMVCGSYASEDGYHILLNKEGARLTFIDILTHPTAIITGANIAYDMLVMAVDLARQGTNILPAIFAKYDAGKVYDPLIAEALHAVGRGHLGRDPYTGNGIGKGGKPGRYSLENVTRFVLGREDAKANDEWRLRYAELDGIPIEEWPPEAKQYPVDDAVNTLEVTLAQLGLKPNTGPHRFTSQGCEQCNAPLGDPSPCVSTWPRMNLHDLSAQVYTAWAMHLGAAWGFAVDGAAVDALEAAATEARVRDLQQFVDAGLIEDGKKDTSDIKRRVAMAYGAYVPCETCGGSCKTPSEKTGKPVQCKVCSATGLRLEGTPTPRTEKGAVSTARDTLSESGDELLMGFADYLEDAKLLETYVPYLRKGVGAPLTLIPNVLLETGRTSYSESIQTLPRKGGVRDCIVPREGTVFCSVDYEAGELITHAQSCLWIVGHSELATALLAGVKPHNALAASMMGLDYEEYQKRFKAGDKMAVDLRQAAKAANFGFPGGMGEAKLVIQKRKEDFETVTADGRVYKGIRFCILMDGAKECGKEKVTQWKKATFGPTCLACIKASKRLRDFWYGRWPENKTYFDAVSRQVEQFGEVVQHVSGRIRGGVEFTSAANGYFQGLLGDAAKKALRDAVRECYLGFTVEGKASDLHGSRVIVFLHDELIAEVPAVRAHEAGTRLGQVMEGALKMYCPDLAPAIRAEPALMTRWLKGAEPKYEGGRLVPWR